MRQAEQESNFGFYLGSGNVCPQSKKISPIEPMEPIERYPVSRFLASVGEMKRSSHSSPDKETTAADEGLQKP